MKLIVVRHAHAGSRRGWDGRDRDRPLSETGFGQADELVRGLADFKPKRLLSSPRLRCVQTIEPAAKKLAREVEVDDRLDEGPSSQALLSLIDELAGTTAVLCSHGDVIPHLIRTLRDERGLKLPDQITWPKASTWILKGDKHGRFSKSTFVPPPGK